MLSSLLPLVLASVPIGVPGASTAGTAAVQDLVRAHLGQDAYALARLDLPAGTPEQWTLDVPIAGRNETIDLVRHSVRGPDFRLLVDRGAGVLEEVAPPPVSTYRGMVRGWPQARVALTLTEAGARGLVVDGGAAWAIEPASDAGVRGTGLTIVSPVVSSPFQHGRCGTPDPADRGASLLGVERDFTGSPTCLTLADIAFDCDYECYLLNGSSVTATLQDVEAVLDGVIVPYETDVYITYSLGTVIVRAAEPDPYTATDSGVLLTEFQTEWNGPQATVPRDVVHLATGKDLDSNIIGLAYVGTLCPNGAEYGLTQWTLSFSGRVSVVAHEVGHNWSAPHCLDPTFCGIMCGGCVLSFGPNTIQQIIGFRNTRSCVDFPPPTITSLFPSSTIPSLVPGTQETIGIVGDCFTDSSTVVVDGVSLDDIPETYTVQADSFTSFEMPQVSTLGPVEVRVDDPHGSASTTATIVAPATPVHQAGTGDPSNLLYTSTGAPFVLAGQPGALHLLLYSLSNVPSSLPLVSLGLGNNFTDIGFLGPYAIGDAGYTAFTLPLPSIAFTTFYTQTIDLSAGAPFPASNLQEVYVLY